MKGNFRSYNLAVEFYKLSRTVELDRNLRDQLARAASSIVLNLAEGSGRRTKNDRARFFQIAFGSIRECQAIVDLAENKKDEIYNKLDTLAANVYKLLKNCAGA